MTVSGNTMTGDGPADYIAQNGIQLGRGATGTISGNTVTGNAYTGTNDASSAGILVFGGGSYGRSRPASRSPTTRSPTTTWASTSTTPTRGIQRPTTKTKNSIVNNTISNDEATNVSGNGSPDGYQAGIVDFGNSDNIVNNKISGLGYLQLNAPTAGSIYTQIDLNDSTNGARQQQRLDHTSGRRGRR